MQTSVTSCSSLSVCVGVVATSDLVFFSFFFYSVIITFFLFLLVFAAIYLSVCQFLSISSFLLSSPPKISPFSLWLLTLYMLQFFVLLFQEISITTKKTSHNRNLDRYHHQQHKSLFFVIKKCQNYITMNKTRS